jgi:ATP-binding cassette, subfamily B, bacterial
MALLHFVRPGASDRELSAAVRLADFDRLVATLERGLHQRIGPDGCQISGGQRQRLAMARALLPRPQILILDEATSCLGTASEGFILRNVLESLSASTLMVVTHRASTAASFERVLAFSSGRIMKDSMGLTPSNVPAYSQHC